jgi:peptidoglycan/xylan/chitin deacetylase (PgdA/CDA1 family)
MEILQPQESFFITSGRMAYRLARGTFRKVRAVKNRITNLVDRPLIILIYHRVTNLSADPEMLAVSPANFRRQMEYLKQHFHIVRFDEDWAPLEEPAVVVTFDDGYVDNLYEALPVLEDLGVPATFFISTGRLGTGKEFWWHRLEGILLREGEFPASFDLKDPHFGRSWETATFEQRKRLYGDLNLRLLKIGPDRQEAWLEQLEKWGGEDKAGKERHRTMNKEELQKLAASPWSSIGAHTVTHSALSALKEKQQRREIFSSKLELEQITGREITTFSYPFGRKQDYDRTSVRLCREAGFTKAASNFPGQVHRWSDPYQLPRHLVRNWNPETFSVQMETFWTR